MLYEQDASKPLNLLSNCVKPLHYNLRIFNIEFGGEWAYEGRVIIDAEAIAPEDRLVINAYQIEILRSEVSFDLDGSSLTHSATSTILNENDQQACLSFRDTIPKGSFQLSIAFKGRISQSMTGFCRARYELQTENSVAGIKVGKYHWQLTTDFEPCDARKAFPCFDEPHLKATFELELEIPKALTALSNMPEKSVLLLDGSQAGLKAVRFEKTPVMSTYLLCWAIGDFEYIEAFTKREHSGRRIPVRIYTTKGLTKYAHFALQDACNTLDFFSESFGVDYPLPKCDHLVVHEFISGAMENWGLITYKPTKILFDPSTSDNRLMSKASYVIAHELAHQWFGNLVTMSGWNELWLNEGFATWAGYLAVDHLHPDWNIWGQFVDEALEEAFTLDSLRSSHPIESQVESDSRVHQMFDSITYCKGSAIIRMLAAHIGDETFLKGIAAYLKSRSYQNATSNDLWKALSAASGVDVATLMDSWLHEAGFPMVTAAPTFDGLHLTQKPFPRYGAEQSNTCWHVPLGLDRESFTTTDNILTAPSGSFNQLASLPRLNRDHAGFYRTDYTHGHLMSLTSLSSGLSSAEKVGIITDIASLVFAGLKPTGELLTFMGNFRHEKDCFLWSQIRKSAAAVVSSVSHDLQAVKGLKTYFRQLMREVKSEISWTGSADSYVKGELEKSLIQLAALADDEEVLDEIRRRFSRWNNGDKDAINRNLQSVIFGVSVVRGEEEEYHAIKAEYIRNNTIDGREICITAMGRTKIPAMARDFLDFTFLSEDHVTLQNIHFVGMALGNGSCAEVLWDYVKDNWDAVYARLRINSVVFEWFIDNALSSLDSLEVEYDIAQFFAAKDLPEIDHPVNIVRDSIKRNAAYKARAGPEVSQWLRENGLLALETAKP
ncbi:uncharacterized protein Z520_08621 [Fonsecaea multimorphosa CBS 102226]|uniref:Aminopeptidase n=1 Tax=Fonsecaea multimorphosa CBS 102226 TaxID=1442371 RepID=A0A0D2IEJ3_9EURO|nr:uncharacterized protein Z520_08621 [Fonsecaea multimorphosa CBS 102226]KIX95501.1 hypothetical protein Z520_08621 [Fonsecaea multimorphosa CBS 102226]OAL21347.1 hypothetical protein AYO22_08070 [Fonsecaea multimorphosa]